MSWALVRSGQFGVGGSSATTITNNALAAGAANGDLLVAFVSWDFGGSATISSITDNGTGAANTWNTAWEVTQTSDNQRNAMIWCVNQRTGGTLTTVTVTITVSSSYRAIILREYSGNHASPNDGTNNSGATGSHSSGTDVISSGALTPSVAGDLIVGGTYNSLGTGATAGTNFGNLISETTGPAIFMDDRTEAGTASSPALFSDSGANNHLCGVVAFKAAAADVTVALTGVSATGAIGAFALGIALALGGVSATGAVGTVAPTQGITGVSSASAVGAVVPNITVALSGVASVGSVGALATDRAVALSGVAGTGAVGSISPGSAAALVGVSGSGAAGSVSPSTDIPLSGVAGTGAVGTVTAFTGLNLPLTGVAGTGEVGNVAVDVSAALAGVAGSGTIGSVAPGQGVSGVSGTGAVGALTPGMSLALSGVVATGAVGSVAVSGGDVVVPAQARIAIRRGRSQWHR
jgi:hypothetical protein